MSDPSRADGDYETRNEQGFTLYIPDLGWTWGICGDGYSDTVGVAETHADALRDMAEHFAKYCPGVAMPGVDADTAKDGAR